MINPHPLRSDAPVIVYLDIKSPYAYLAVEPTRQLEQTLGMRFDWRPFVLDIPSYLGSARLGAEDEVIQSQRSDTQWAAVKYAYADCRRYARLAGKTIRGTVKIWDTHLVSSAMLWLREHEPDLLPAFIDRVYAPFWIRELDVECEEVIGNLLRESGLSAATFLQWAHDEGLRQNACFQEQAFELGVFGVPSYIVDGQRYFGREHLPRIRWQLEGSSGSTPDIAYTVPEVLPVSLKAPQHPPRQIHIGVDESLDSLLALPQLCTLLTRFAGEVYWTKLPVKSWLHEAPVGEASRARMHHQFRLENERANAQRYGVLIDADADPAQELRNLMRRYGIRLQSSGPEPLLNRPMPGIAVQLDDELFIGRQHLPLLAARIKQR